MTDSLILVLIVGAVGLGLLGSIFGSTASGDSDPSSDSGDSDSGGGDSGGGGDGGGGGD